MEIRQYNFDESRFLKDLRGLLKIESVALPPDKAAPEGKALGGGVAKALSEFEAIGRGMGMRTKNLDNVCVWIEWGNAAEMTGLLVHADTVSASPEGWDYPPFDATVSGERVYGRGSCDDKGPALLALYAMQAVAKTHDPDSLRVRLIIGGDEESGLDRCIERYKQTEEMPARAFSPDSQFPVTFAEKGLLRARFTRRLYDGEPKLKISSGTVYNVVPSYASAVLPDNEAVEAFGHSAHASTPDEGDNALLRLCENLRLRGIDHPFLQLAAIANAKGLGIDFSDEISGSLTINPALADVNDEQMSLGCDIRVPVTVTLESVMDAMKSHVSGLGFDVECVSYTPPLHVPRDSSLVSTLQQVWSLCTGRNDPPVSSGGATYARAFTNAVAFGILFPGEPVTYHQPNEYLDLKSARYAFQILANAITNLK